MSAATLATMFTVIFGLAACGADRSGSPTETPRSGAGSVDESTSGPGPTMSADCFDPEPPPPQRPSDGSGLATSDLPNAARWAGARCVDEAVLAPAVQRYREHNLRVATEQLRDRGLSIGFRLVAEVGRQDADGFAVKLKVSY